MILNCILAVFISFPRKHWKPMHRQVVDKSHRCNSYSSQQQLGKHKRGWLGLVCGDCYVEHLCDNEQWRHALLGGLVAPYPFWLKMGCPGLNLFPNPLISHHKINSVFASSTILNWIILGVFMSLHPGSTGNRCFDTWSTNPTDSNNLENARVVGWG